jgi:hypothetical protein
MALVSGTEIFSESEWTELVKELSLPTVRTHLSRIFSRFDVQDRTELVLYVFRYFCHEHSHL